MLLVFCPKISSRLRYIFHHVLTNSLGIAVDFTTTLDTFIAHSGPKMSYGKAPLGNEFFVEAADLLFQYGVQDTPIEVKKWEELPCFFSVGKKSKLPFDLFAASFYLLSRYEEYLPHLKDDLGRFVAQQSLAYQHKFLEQPLVDQWVAKFADLLQEDFPELRFSAKAEERFMPLVEVVSPFKYKFKSVFANGLEWVKALTQLNFWALVEQPLVLLGFRKDPWDNFRLLAQHFSTASFKMRFFFLYTNESYMDRGITYRNKRFQDKIKGVADYFNTVLLASFNAVKSDQTLGEERKNLSTLIHRQVESIRFAWGLKTAGETYRHLIMQEVEQDFSMGYPITYGYRASTAVPFFFYDFSSEMMSSLQLFPVVCNENILRQYSPIEAIKKLKTSEEQLSLTAGVHAFAISNSAFEFTAENQSFRSLLLDYFTAHDQ